MWKREFRDFPDGPVVKTSPCNAGGTGLIPGWGAKIPHISQPKKKKSQSRGSKKFNKDFKNGPHQIKIFKRRKKMRLS